MKRKSLAIFIAFLALSINACNYARPTQGSSSISQSQILNNDIYAVYRLYQAQGGDLSYDEWLLSIKGEPGKDGNNGLDGHSPVVRIGNDGYWYIDDINTGVKAQGEPGQQGPSGQNGSDGRGVISIQYDHSDGNIDTYVITYSDGSHSYFTVTNGINGQNGTNGNDGAQGPKGEQGIQGQPGADGHTPVITISDDGYWVVDDVKTSTKAQGPKGDVGPQGPSGQNGSDGRGIISIQYDHSEGAVDTYVITYTDGATSTFTVTNGSDGQNGQDGHDGAQGPQGEPGIQGQPGSDGHTPIITISEDGYWVVDGIKTNTKAQGPKGDTGSQGAPGNDGRGIVSIQFDHSDDNVDTYIITYSDGSCSYFTVTNGTNGQNGADGHDGTQGPQGEQGIQGQPGTDGHTPVITISDDGYWVVDGVKTNTKAQGPQGEKGDTGDTGPQGISVISTYINENGDLIVVYSDGREVNAGNVKDVTNHIVSFYIDGNKVAVKVVSHNAKVSEPTSEEIGGLSVNEWYYYNEVIYREWVFFGYTVTEDINLYAFTNSYVHQDGTLNHIFSSDWTYDETYHWHASLCGHNVINDKEEHSFVTVQSSLSSCENDGYDIKRCTKCGAEVRIKTGSASNRHHFVNGKCADCGKHLADMCSNNLGVYFNKYQNGNNLVRFYNDVNKTLLDMYKADAELPEDIIFVYKNYYLSLNEAVAVLQRIIYDKPLYYFLSGTIFANDTFVWFETHNEYRSIESQNRIKGEIDNFINHFENTKDSNDTFDIVWMAHDYLLESVDYAFDENSNPSVEGFAHSIVGVLEKTGAVCEGYSKSFHLVCDYYGIPNLIATGTVKEESHSWNTVHIDGEWYWIDATWDDVRLPSVFYWHENHPSWPDLNNFSDLYKYFLVSDDKIFDDHVLGGSDFDCNKLFMYEIEGRSNVSYLDNHKTRLWSTFAENNIEYQFCKYNDVTVTYIDIIGEATIPETVSHNGNVYNVVSIGTYYTGDILYQNILRGFNKESKLVLSETVSALVISSTIEHIYDSSLSADDFKGGSNDVLAQNHLISIFVNENNKTFCSVDGVLYTKDRKMLVAYPFDSDATEYTLLPETLLCDSSAFCGLFKNLLILNFNENFCDYTSDQFYNIYPGGESLDMPYLAVQYLGRNVGGKINIDQNNKVILVYEDVIYTILNVFKQFNEGEVQYDYECTIVGFSDLNKETYVLPEYFTINDKNYYVNAFLPTAFLDYNNGVLIGVTQSVFDHLLSTKNFICENPMFSFDGCCLYYSDSILYYRHDVENIVLPDSVTVLYSGAFSECENLKSITIPVSVTSICPNGGNIFGGSLNLKDIYYEGTIEQWNSISFSDNWDWYTSEMTIHCSNGNIIKPANLPDWL